MKRSFFALMLLTVILQGTNAQTVAVKLSRAWTTFEKDAQLQNAIASLYVIDAVTGAIVFDKNSRTGLAPASTQKIITSAAAYEVLGKNFRYETKLGYYGNLHDGKLDGGIYILPSGDPTLGSWRWKQTSEELVLQRMIAALVKSGIRQFNGFLVDASGWSGESIAGGWIWDDIANYYGAGANIFNWRENQYDLYMQSGSSIGDAVQLTGTKPRLYNHTFQSFVTSAAKGSGDNAYIYFPAGNAAITVRGTIPVGEKKFTISGAMPSPHGQFLSTLQDSLSARAIAKKFPDVVIDETSKDRIPANIKFLHTELSPPLDSISYWFLKRSINLYGEALAKTIAAKKSNSVSSASGGQAISNFWSDKKVGVAKTELNMHDGSGLSPLNRVTTHAQVAVLQYAKKQAWFSSYVSGFPEYNGMQLKSGTINGVKSFCGYHTAKDGRQYIVSFIVNNYNGPSSSLVQKMYAVLNELK